MAALGRLVAEIRSPQWLPGSSTMIASIFDTLDRHSGSATVLLTAALVLVTAYYAWMNRRAVSEMKAARDATLLPKLALEFHRLGPNVVDLAIRTLAPE